jgi:hypothetical protein
MPTGLYHPTEVLKAFREEFPHRFDSIPDGELLDAIRDEDPDTFKLVDPQLIGAELLPSAAADGPPKPLAVYHPPPSTAERVITSLPRVGGILVGGAAGGYFGAPTYGAMAGGLAGEIGAEKLEEALGSREALSPTEIGVQTAMGAYQPIKTFGGPLARTALRAGEGAMLGTAGDIAEQFLTHPEAPPQFRAAPALTGAAFGGVMHGATEVYHGVASLAPDLAPETYGLPTGPPPPAPRSRALAAAQIQVFARQAEAQDIATEFGKRGWDIPPSQRGSLQYGLETKAYLDRLAELGQPLVPIPENLGELPPPAPLPPRLLPASPIIGYGPEGPPPSDLVVPGTPQRGVVAQPTIDRLEEQLTSGLQNGPEGPPRLNTQQQLRLTAPSDRPPDATTPPLFAGGPPPDRPQRLIEKPATDEQPYLPGVANPRPLDRTYAEGPNAGPRREGELHGEPRTVRRRVVTPGQKGYRYEQAPADFPAEDPGTYPPDVRRELARMAEELTAFTYEPPAYLDVPEGGGNRQSGRTQYNRATPGAPVYHDILATLPQSHATRQEVLQGVRASLLEGKGSLISDAAAQVARTRLAQESAGLTGARRQTSHTLPPGAGDALIGWVDEAGMKALPDQHLTPEQQAAREATPEEIRHALYAEDQGLVTNEDTRPFFQAMRNEAVRRGMIRPQQQDLVMEAPGGAGGPTLFDFEGTEPPPKPTSSKILPATDPLEQQLVERYGEDHRQWPAHLRQTGTFREDPGTSPPALPEEPALNRSRPEAQDYTARVLGQVADGAPGLADETRPSAIPALGDVREIIYRGPDGRPVAVARLLRDSEGRLMVEDFAADKGKGLLTGRAVMAVGKKLQALGATTPAGTVTPDALNLIAHAKAMEGAAPPGLDQPSLPGAEDVRTTENPTPPVAEAPFVLTPPPTKPARVGERTPPPLLRRLFEDDGVLILDVPNGNREGLQKWLDRQEEQHGTELWYSRVEQALEDGDYDRAWKLAASASVRSYAKTFAETQTPEGEEALRRAVQGTPLQADIQTEIVGAARRRSIPQEEKAPYVPDFPPSAQVSQAGAARGKARLGPAGVINPGSVQRPLEGKYTDFTLSKTLQRSIIESSDPELLHLIPGSTDTNLRLYRQVADLAFRGANTREVKQYLKLSDEEIAQHFLRGVQEAARTLQQLSAFRQVHAKTLDRAAEAMSMGGALEGMIGGEPPTIVGARGRVIGRVGSIEPERTLEALAEQTRSFDQAMLTNTLQKPRKQSELELLQAASYPFMISKWATAVRNAVTQAGRYGVEALDDALTIPLATILGDQPSATLAKGMARERLAATTRGGAYVPPTRAWKETVQDIYNLTADTLSNLSPEDARSTLKVLTEFPTEAANFLGWASSAGEEVGGRGPSKFGPLNALLDPKLQRLLTVFNRAQEFTGRALVFDASMRAQIRAKGLDPLEILQLPPEQIAQRVGGATALDELIHNSVAGALEATFASRASKDSIPGALVRFVNTAWPLKLGYPFPKFNLSAAPRFIWDHGPWALMDLVRFPLDAAGITSTNLGGSRLYRRVRAARYEQSSIPELVGKRQAAEGRLGSAVRDLVASRRELAVRNRLVSRLEGKAQAGLPEVQTALEQATSLRDQLTRRVDRAQQAVGTEKSSIRDLRSQEEKLLESVREAHGIGAPTLPQYFARIATGTFGSLAAAFVIRSQPAAQGTKWYEYRVDREGKDPITLDFRPFAPFAQYLFVADVMQDFSQHTDWAKVHQDMQENAGPVDWASSMWQHYTGKYTGEELGSQFAQAFLSMSRAAGTTLTITDLLTQNGWPSPQAATDAIVGTIGQFLSRFTVPLQQLKDLAGAVSPEEAKARITPRATMEEPYRPLADPLANVPYLSEVIPDRISQTTGKPVATEYPLLRALAGIGTAPKDFVTEEVQRVGVPGQSVFIRETGDYPLDRMVAESYSRILQQELPDILEAEEYRQLGTPADQRDYLQRYIFPALKRAALGEVRETLGETEFQGATVRGEAARRQQRQRDLVDRLQGELGPAPPDDTAVPDLPPGPPPELGAPPPPPF